MLINTRTQNIQSSLWRIIDWFYPPSCCSCGKIGKIICDDCFSNIEKTGINSCIRCVEPIRKHGFCARCKKNPPNYSMLRSLGYYSGPLRDAVLSLKYQRNIGLGEFISSSLSEIVLREGWSIDLLTAVPLNAKRKRERGYNQAEVLAIPLARKLNKPYLSDLIQRVKSTTSQVGLSLQERQLNVADAFKADPLLSKNQTILLVDDVATTGATMNACAKALMVAGCREVFSLTLAKTIGLQDDLVGTKNSIFRR
jgi:competence protein ComFC